MFLSVECQKGRELIAVKLDQGYFSLLLFHGPVFKQLFVASCILDITLNGDIERNLIQYLKII